jgi:hypothetical protein
MVYARYGRTRLSFLSQAARQSADFAPLKGCEYWAVRLSDILFLMHNSAVFRVKYDGPALASHEMDVKDLAPALLAIGELIEEANRALNGNQVGVRVNVKATEPGCVDVVLSAVQSLYSQAVGLFNGDGVNSVLNVLQILTHLGFAGAGSAAGRAA